MSLEGSGALADHVEAHAPSKCLKMWMSMNVAKCPESSEINQLLPDLRRVFVRSFS